MSAICRTSVAVIFFANNGGSHPLVAVYDRGLLCGNTNALVLMLGCIRVSSVGLVLGLCSFFY